MAPKTLVHQVSNPKQQNSHMLGFWRVKSIVAPHGPLPMSRSSWLAGVRSGRYPQPIKLGPRTTVWRIEDIQDLIASLEADGR